MKWIGFNLTYRLRPLWRMPTPKSGQLVSTVLAIIGTSLVSSLIVLTPVFSEEFEVTEGYENRPDDDPFHYFPTRPFLREGMARMSGDLSRFSNVSRVVRDSVLDELDEALATTTFFFSDNFTSTALYNAAITVGDCRLGEDLIWEQLISDRPFLDDFRQDSFFARTFMQDVLQDHFPALAACLYAQDARTLSTMIAQHSLQFIGTDNLVRPFVHHQSWFSARGTLHGRRDRNFWDLVQMAANPHRSTYAPAAVMLVELALELDSLNLPNDIITMLLLRAEQSWPVDDRPLPVARERIAELLDQIRPQLSEGEIARAHRCYMTNELYDRLFLGDASYFEAPEEEQCQVDVGSAD